MSNANNKTNVDNVVVAAWVARLIMWCTVTGAIGNILFVMTAFGFVTPVYDVYFSPTFWGRALNQVFNNDKP